ncbi:hypothetical protein C802_03539 [Phocaeicola sartorii]|uniref:Uncharacterized protein n=1 Tax=Phocaeicola sartorii TaxID=671267 RepID=R9HZJ4_9BACT|nr:hypothetical protein C802_03539 [Phocaeicola sartorii]
MHLDIAIKQLLQSGYVSISAAIIFIRKSQLIL